MSIRFRKMHGLGNDFVVIDRRAHEVALNDDLVRAIGDRHRGVGFDQLILIDHPSTSDLDAEITFYNSDGSVAGACGNGTRCVASLILDEQQKPRIALGSPAGPLPARRTEDGLIEVAMPAPRLDWQEIPLAKACDTLDVPVNHPILGNPTAVSMGNPHAVFFVDDIEAIDVVALGAELERHPLFADRANIGFAQMLGPNSMRLRVFERGAGLTLACGSGACAALVAAIRRKLVEHSATLTLDGGTLQVSWDGEGPVLMTGPFSHSFDGTWL